MKRLVLLSLAIPLLLVPGRTTLAAWTDPTPPSATTTLDALTLTAPTLSCTNGLLQAVVSWTASTYPTTLSYTAVVVQDTAGPLSVITSGLTRTVTVGLSQLLSTLTGQTVTLRVTATLPGTLWTVSSDVSLKVGALGVGVSCA